MTAEKRSCSGFLAAGDRHGAVQEAWHANKTVRSTYDIATRPSRRSSPASWPSTSKIVTGQSSSAPWAALPPLIRRDQQRAKGIRVQRAHRNVNNLIKRIKRIGFGSFRYYRTGFCSMPHIPTGTYSPTVTSR